MMGQPLGYCFSVGATRMAPWRATVHEAKEDAIDAGFADRDEYAPDRIWITVPGEIGCTFEPVEIEPRPPRPTMLKQDTYPSRIERIIARREAQEGSKAA